MPKLVTVACSVLSLLEFEDEATEKKRNRVGVCGYGVFEAAVNKCKRFCDLHTEEITALKSEPIHCLCCHRTDLPRV